jgi:hypothetical protein
MSLSPLASPVRAFALCAPLVFGDMAVGQTLTPETSAPPEWPFNALEHYSDEVGWQGMRGASRAMGRASTAVTLTQAAVEGDTAALVGSVAGITVGAAASLHPVTRFAAVPLAIATDTLVRNSLQHVLVDEEPRLLVDVLAERHGIDYNMLSPERNSWLDINIALYEAVIAAERDAIRAHAGLYAPNFRLNEDLERLREERDRRNLEDLSRIPAPGFEPMDSTTIIPPSSANETPSGVCTVTEDALGAFFAQQYGGLGMASNNAVIAVSNAPTTEVISRDPIIYRLRDPDLCTALGSNSDTLATEATEIATAIRLLRDEAISEGCEGRPGSISDNAVFLRDLDADGNDDLILSHDGIVCAGRPQRSGFCGAQVCTLVFFLRRGDSLQLAGEDLALLDGIDNSSPPVITLYRHGGVRAQVQWNGTQFVDL